MFIISNRPCQNQAEAIGLFQNIRNRPCHKHFILECSCFATRLKVMLFWLWWVFNSLLFSQNFNASRLIPYITTSANVQQCLTDLWSDHGSADWRTTNSRCVTGSDEALNSSPEMKSSSQEPYDVVNLSISRKRLISFHVCVRNTHIMSILGVWWPVTLEENNADQFAPSQCCKWLKMLRKAQSVILNEKQI